MREIILNNTSNPTLGTLVTNYQESYFRLFSSEVALSERLNTDSVKRCLRNLVAVIRYANEHDPNWINQTRSDVNGECDSVIVHRTIYEHMLTLQSELKRHAGEGVIIDNNVQCALRELIQSEKNLIIKKENMLNESKHLQTLRKVEYGARVLFIGSTLVATAGLATWGIGAAYGGSCASATGHAANAVFFGKGMSIGGGAVSIGSFAVSEGTRHKIKKSDRSTDHIRPLSFSQSS